MDCEESIFFEGYKLGDVVGHGTYGTIYNIDEKTVMKVGDFNSDICKEYILYRRLYDKYPNAKWLPDIYKYGTNHDSQYIVMEKLGKSIDHCCQQNLDTTFQYIQKVIRIIEKIHSMGYVYVDVKGDNFLTNINDPTDVKVIDLGFMLVWKDIEGIVPKNFKEDDPIYGVSRYASVHSHEHKRPSRRDDMISIGYMALDIINRYILPWKNDDPYWKIYKKKVNKSYLNCNNVPIGLEQYLEYVPDLKYESTPDYEFCVDCFER